MCWSIRNGRIQSLAEQKPLNRLKPKQRDWLRWRRHRPGQNSNGSTGGGVVPLPKWSKLSSAWRTFYSFFSDARTAQTRQLTPSYCTPIDAIGLKGERFEGFINVSASIGEKSPKLQFLEMNRCFSVLIVCTSISAMTPMFYKALCVIIPATPRWCKKNFWCKGSSLPKALPKAKILAKLFNGKRLMKTINCRIGIS
jgi:hypothetical protein